MRRPSRATRPGLRRDVVGHLRHVTDTVRHRQKPPRWWALAGFLAAVALVATVGALAIPDASGQYANLRKPAFAPPAALFGPVWTVLYLMIAVSGWLAWQHAGFRAALVVYCLQLLANAAWTPLFFAAEQYELALADIIALWLLIGLTVVLFWPVSRLAALLLLPYWAWVTYATALNAEIVRLN